MAALLDSGINASKAPSPDKKTWEVRIAQGDFPMAMQVLHSKGLPRRQSETLGELFKKEGFASSALEEKARYIYGLQEAMRQKLLKLDGVVDADVSIALPDRDPLGGDARESSASVFIYQAPGVDLRDRETDLKVGVKDGIEGLDDVNKVTIKFFTVAAPAAGKQASRGAAAMPSLSSISPLAIGDHDRRWRCCSPCSSPSAAASAHAWRSPSSRRASGTDEPGDADEPAQRVCRDPSRLVSPGGHGRTRRRRSRAICCGMHATARSDAGCSRAG